jgi:hypothetical protein
VVARYQKNWTSGEHDGQQRHTWLEADLAWHPSNGKTVLHGKQTGIIIFIGQSQHKIVGELL